MWFWVNKYLAEEGGVMHERFTDHVRTLMEHAHDEAAILKQDHVGTEHLLLGLVQCDGFGTKILQTLGASAGSVRREVERRVKPAKQEEVVGKLLWTPRAKRVFERAIDMSRCFGDDYVGTEHVLLGLLEQSEGPAAEVLRFLRVTHSAALEHVQDRSVMDKRK